MADQGPRRPFLAVDIGNTRLKVGLFEPPCALTEAGLPCPSQTFAALPNNLSSLLDHLPLLSSMKFPLNWVVASVNRPVTDILREFLAKCRPQDSLKVLENENVGLHVDLPSPASVGIDRLLGAKAANAVRRTDHGAIVVDIGSAITVDFISRYGAFSGGAILPGPGLGAWSLHAKTDRLPEVDITNVASEAAPATVGRSTEEAITSGLYWGTVGAVRELVERVIYEQDTPCDLFITGGSASSLAENLPMQVTHVPHLVLSGIALVALGK